MKVDLFPFQNRALKDIRYKVAKALGDYASDNTPQVVSYTAPTGAGKTIIMASLIETIYFGDGSFPDQPNAIFVWLSDSPELNEQSKMKIDLKADKILPSQTETIDDSSFDNEYLEDGKIYFLNTQKLSINSNLTKHTDNRQFTIWDTIRNTARDKADRLYFIIDEAHRGMQGSKAASATTIMQKFLKGSEKDGIDALPVVIGITATPERFTNLVSGLGTTTIRKVITTADEVRDSGLLKDKIIINYPDTLNNEMAVLQAATDDWMEKVVHWDQYCFEQHYAYVRPVFVVQVQNGSGSKLSDTDLDECLQKIEGRMNLKLVEGEVVHTFGQTDSGLILNGLKVKSIEPSRIADDKNIKIVFFKENLSTGWDCPRAETMMSFRHANDATYIAQLLGRMVRTPMQMHIQVDEILNNVHLFLPFFNSETVEKVVEELQNSEGGNISDIVGESMEERKIDTLSVKPFLPPITPAKLSDLKSVSDYSTESKAHSAPTISFESKKVVDNTMPLAATNREDYSTNDLSRTLEDPKREEITKEVSTIEAPNVTGEETNIETFDRFAVMTAVNKLGLLSYDVRKVRISDYYKSMFELSRLLVQSGIDTTVNDSICSDIVEMIHNHINNLKESGQYDELVTNVMQFKLKSQIFDVFGNTITDNTSQDLFSTTDTDIDRQFSLADIKLGREGIGTRYGQTFFDDDNPNAFKIDVIIFAADEECKRKYTEYAKNKYHSLVDSSRIKAIGLNEKMRKKYDSIVSNGDIISKHNFRLPETISALHDSDGQAYSNHLFLDYKGEAFIKLNDWEAGVIEEESKKESFVCWLRNIPRAAWALCIPYGNENDKKATYPDFLVIHKTADSNYAVDILEPHDPTRNDNLPKAKGFAWYAGQNPGVNSIQLIRVMKDISGTKKFKRLDLSKSLVREKVLHATNNEELDQIFDSEGYYI